MNACNAMIHSFGVVAAELSFLYPMQPLVDSCSTECHTTNHLSSLISVVAIPIKFSLNYQIEIFVLYSSECKNRRFVSSQAAIPHLCCLWSYLTDLLVETRR